MRQRDRQSLRERKEEKLLHIMVVTVTDIQVLNNPTNFQHPFLFEISFECAQALKHDLDWKLIYVGSAEDDKHDQVLDSVQVGPLQPGFMKFQFQVDPPDVEKIPSQDLLEVTVILLTCEYDNRELIRVGYYVYNQYDPESGLAEEPPKVPQLDKITRTIMADHPRVTKYNIDFDEPSKANSMPEPPAEGADVENDLMDMDMLNQDEEEANEEQDDEDEDDDVDSLIDHDMSGQAPTEPSRVQPSAEHSTVAAPPGVTSIGDLQVASF